MPEIILTPRQLKEIYHALHYKIDLGGFGTVGHNQLELIATLATALGFVYEEGNYFFVVAQQIH